MWSVDPDGGVPSPASLCILQNQKKKVLSQSPGQNFIIDFYFCLDCICIQMVLTLLCCPYYLWFAWRCFENKCGKIWSVTDWWNQNFTWGGAVFQLRCHDTLHTGCITRDWCGMIDLNPSISLCQKIPSVNPQQLLQSWCSLLLCLLWNHEVDSFHLVLNLTFNIEIFQQT